MIKQSVISSYFGLIIIAFLVSCFSLSCAPCFKKRLIPPVIEGWEDVSYWQVATDGRSAIDTKVIEEADNIILQLNYKLKGDYGWVQIERPIDEFDIENIPLIFKIKAIGRGDLEVELIDSDGSIFGRKLKLSGKYHDWSDVVIYKKNLEYWWGGDDKFDDLTKMSFAVSGAGKGILWLDKIRPGAPGQESSLSILGPRLDPDRNLKGIGFRQRRADKIIPEDPLILEWLKQIQDTATTNKDLLSSAEGNQIHTFNNSLVAMAFILKGERERAERILDFYAEATDKDNDQAMLQNFYYKGEARGFFQSVSPKEIDGKEYYYNMANSDRWMGDIAWLLLAYKYYQQTYDSQKYQEITRLLKDLLISWYKDADNGGYVQHGWRSGDKRLHESYGHPEGNIDCYAAFKICGEDECAEKIKIWLDKSISGGKLPLDLFTWRVLAYGPEAVDLLDIPEFDLRYRKTLRVNDEPVAGFYHGPEEIENIWLDGTGHIACAYITLGDKQRGYFYSNQLDAYIIERDFRGVRVHVLPYTANGGGGYGWVDTDKGFVSVGAWYIFSKNGFNPLKLEKVPVND